MIVDALEEAPTDAFKQAMVACYLDPSPYIQHYLHDAFETYVDDPLIGSQVQKVLAKVPDSKERRKRQCFLRMNSSCLGICYLNDMKLQKVEKGIWAFIVFIYGNRL